MSFRAHKHGYVRRLRALLDRVAACSEPFISTEMRRLDADLTALEQVVADDIDALMASRYHRYTAIQAQQRHENSLLTGELLGRWQTHHAAMR